jgi:hypothetical protein
MFASLYVKLGLVVAALALLGGAWWYVNDHAYDRGAASRQPMIDSLNAQIDVDATTMRTINAQAAANAELATSQQQAAQAAIEQVTKQSQTTQQNLKDSLARYAKAKDTADCAPAKVKLCAALSYPY